MKPATFINVDTNQTKITSHEKEDAADDSTTSIYDVFRQPQGKNSNPINLTVGNPNLPPPKEYYTAMDEVLGEIRNQKWNGHGYMVEQDPFGLCQKISTHLKQQFGALFESQDVGITVGATGALDVISKTLLDPNGPCSQRGDNPEVLILAPYFVEYINIIQSNGGVPVIVHTNTEYGLDLQKIEAAINPQTKMIWINSPNNPTGSIYSQNELTALAKIVSRKEKQFDKPIYIVEDAVYDTIHFRGERVPSLVPLHPHLFRVNSWSKSLSLSGERIGYFAMHPDIGSVAQRTTLRDALFLNMRMRVVHAPLLQHRILARLPADCATDIHYYQRNIETLYQCLKQLNFRVVAPQGTFYLWALLPEQFANETQFRTLVMNGDEPLLYLPGFLFGGKKYNRCVRFSACVPFAEIERACAKLEDAVPKSMVPDRSTFSVSMHY